VHYLIRRIAEAIDFDQHSTLLKPFTKVRLDRAIEKASRELEKKTEFNTHIDGLFKTLTEQKHYLERIAVRSQGKILVINVEDIDTLNAESGQISIFSGDKHYSTNYTLNELENRLNPERFFRAHRSAIVNLTKIKEIIPWFAGSYKIKLTTGAEVELSRLQAIELRKIIKW
jgi:DNA-binding LytR/AlgR family response regulator